MGLSLANNYFDIEKTTIKDIMCVAGEVDSYEFVAVDKSLQEIPGLFYRWQNEGKKIEAVLITRNGKANESLKGIITNRDLRWSTGNWNESSRL